jgi:hypothetical protein
MAPNAANVVAGIDKPLHAKHKRFRPEARDGA